MMTKELERRLAEATEIAKKNRHEFVTLEHIFMALTNSTQMVEILEACQVSVQKLKKELREFIKKMENKITEDQLESYGGFESWTPEFTMACHRLFQRSALQVKSSGRNQINEGTLLVSLFYEQESHVLYLLQKQGLSQFDVINFLSHGIGKDDQGEFLPAAAPNNQDESGTGSNSDIDGQEKDASKKSALENFCTNLNEKAKLGKIDPLIGREKTIERLTQILMRRSKNNPLLIGEPGVGKTAVVEGLAQKIVEGQVPDVLKNKIIYSMDIGSLLAGTKFRGDFESRVKSIVKEIKNNPHAILFIDEIHTLVGAGSTSGGSMDASNLLKPALASGDISCIGSTTYTEFRQHFEKDRALNRRFQKVDINEPSQAEAVIILQGLKKRFEDFHHVRFSDQAIIAAVDLSIKHLQGKLLPDKAIDVIDEAGSFARLHAKNSDWLNIEQNEIEATVARMTDLPIASVSSNEKLQLKELDKKLKAVIFGQDLAIDQLTTSIKLSRSGLRPLQKPIGSFLFVGPTGVGKTEVCKQLAQILGIHFHRFDMSEYMEKHSVARLVGAPPGYVGYEEGGLLTEAINKNPYSLLLLDEIEKAHPDIYNILLQVMDAGRLTDSNGRVSDFKNVILVLTSNAGAIDAAKGAIGIGLVERSSISKDAIKKTFAPEFINRLDAIVPFKDLSQDMIQRVVQKFIDELKMQLIEKKVELTVHQEVIQWLIQKGYDPAYGARPLARTVEEHIKKALVDELLFGRLIDGGKVSVEVESGALKFQFTSLAIKTNTKELVQA